MRRQRGWSQISWGWWRSFHQLWQSDRGSPFSVDRAFSRRLDERLPRFFPSWPILQSVTDLGSGPKVASIRRSCVGKEQVEIPEIRDKMRAVVFLTAYKRNRGRFLRGRSSPVVSICLTPKSVAWLEMPDSPVAFCPGAPHISHPTIQILADPELSTHPFSKTVAIAQLWAAYRKPSSYP